jgi:hypothetical protein
MDVALRNLLNVVLLEQIVNVQRYAVKLNAVSRMPQERFVVMLMQNVSVLNLVVLNNVVFKLLLREVANVKKVKVVHVKNHVVLQDAHYKLPEWKYDRYILVC